jgi:hypothetical protein
VIAFYLGHRDEIDTYLGTPASPCGAKDAASLISFLADEDRKRKIVTGLLCRNRNGRFRLSRQADGIPPLQGEAFISAVED